MSGKYAIARWIKLDLKHSQVRYGAAVDAAVWPGARWLDIGCGRQLLPAWALDPARQREIARRAAIFIGIDCDSSIEQHSLLRHKTYGVGEHLPFRDGSFDIVTANMVVEHVVKPAVFLREIRRVLSPGGVFVFHTPNYFCYTILAASLIPGALKRRIIRLLEGRREEDVFPTYYRLNTAARIQAATEAAGMEISAIHYGGSSGLFNRCGPLAWLECIPMKLMHVAAGGRFNSNLIVYLGRPTDSERPNSVGGGLIAEAGRRLPSGGKRQDARSAVK